MNGGDGSVQEICRSKHSPVTSPKSNMGSMGDWPEFAMKSDDGEESRWTREVNAKEQNALYRVGNRIEIDYVVQRHRRASLDHGAETKCVIEIRILDCTPEVSVD
jgi:hypothetical protein